MPDYSVRITSRHGVMLHLLQYCTVGSCHGMIIKPGFDPVTAYHFRMQRTEYLFVFSVPGISATSSFLEMSITGILLITR
jgi:hypothetical protein